MTNMTKREILFLISIILTIVLLLIGKMKFFDKNNSDYSLNIVKVNGEWSYEILLDNQPLIVQQNIPVIEGNIPFKNKLDAKKTGSLVLRKLQKGLSPSINIDELSKLKIVKIKQDSLFY